MNAIERIIQQCSGQNGLTNFKKMELNQFIEWFEHDISFNEERSKALGHKAIKALILADKIFSTRFYNFETILNFIEIEDANSEYQDILFLSCPII